MNPGVFQTFYSVNEIRYHFNSFVLQAVKSSRTDHNIRFIGTKDKAEVIDLDIERKDIIRTEAIFKRKFCSVRYVLP